MARWRKGIIGGLAALAVCVFVSTVVFRKNIAVTYHLHQKRTAWRRAREVGSGDSRQSGFLEAYERHLAALVHLGFLQRRAFPLEYIAVPSPASRQLREALQAAFPDHTDVTMAGYEPETRDEVEVWDRPGNMARWEAIIKAHEQRHLAALVNDASIQRAEFPLRCISVPSLALRRLWEELQATFPDHTEVKVQQPDAGGKSAILVWDRPENLPRWEAIIKAHDQPPVGTGGEFTIEATSELRDFVGQWAGKDGIVVLTITPTPDGRLNVAMPSSAPWSLVIRNVRSEGGRLMFDAYWYLQAREETTSPFYPFGDHPFSGVRCQTVLVLDPADHRRMTYSITSIHVPGSIAETLTRVAERTGDKAREPSDKTPAPDRALPPPLATQRTRD
jgi:hypothetical protein